MFSTWKLRVALLAAVSLLTVMLGGCADEREEDQAKGPSTEGLNLQAVHDSSSPQYIGTCIGCHGDMMSIRTLNPAVPNIHARMIPFTPGYVEGKAVSEKVCQYCHTNVDLTNDESAGNLRRNVAVETCAGCHGPGGPGKRLYAN